VRPPVWRATHSFPHIGDKWGPLYYEDKNQVLWLEEFTKIICTL
jgi:hypothetical protein